VQAGVCSSDGEFIPLPGSEISSAALLAEKCRERSIGSLIGLLWINALCPRGESSRLETSQPEQLPENVMPAPSSTARVQSPLRLSDLSESNEKRPSAIGGGRLEQEVISLRAFVFRSALRRFASRRSAFLPNRYFLHMSPDKHEINSDRTVSTREKGGKHFECDASGEFENRMIGGQNRFEKHKRL
jgi:hypothetical protein